MLESVFGYTLRGSPNTESAENRIINTNVHYVIRVFATDRWWNYENEIYKFSDSETPWISEKSSCYDNYLNSIWKYLDCRCKVKLPFKENHLAIHDNFTMCRKRLCNTCMKRDLELLKQHDNIF